MFFSDTYKSLRQPSLWIFTTWFKFLMQYRRTIIGPLWIIASPIMFIVFLGALLVGLSRFSTSVFIPHLTCGIVVWTMLGGYLTRSTNVFDRHKAYLLQGKAKQTDIVLMDNAELVIHFLHQCVIIVAVCWFYKTAVFPYALISLIGFALIVINGYWVSYVFGILGIRYRDFGELIRALATILFLATPIIWMPAREDGPVVGRAKVLEAYMDFNPFYHFLEIIRAPLLGTPIDMLSWYVVGAFTVFGYLLAAIFYRMFRRYVVVWL